MSSADPTPGGWPFRSLLFTPGHLHDWIRKAPRYAPDAVILDLEDAVPPEQKAVARDVARDGIAFLQAQGIGALVRINPDSLREDVLGVVAPGLAAICLPKLDNAAQVRQLADLLSYAEGRAGLAHGQVGIVAIPETARGMCDVRSLAEASPRVCSVMTGWVDRAGDDVVFQGDTALAAGFVPSAEGLEQIYLTSKVCMEARAGGARHPVGAIIGTDLADPQRARRLALRLKSAGFTGGVCIHPSHVTIANEVFGPSAQEVAFHAGVLHAMADARRNGLWAVNYRGIMIDQANVANARGVLALARRYGMDVPEVD